jgi:hypothetical protein
VTDPTRDERLRGNDIFANEIVVKQFPQTAALVSILSPRYLESEWYIESRSSLHSARE